MNSQKIKVLITKLGAGIILTVLIFSTNSCKKGKAEHGIITFIKGHVTLEDSSKKQSKAMLGGHVATGDTLKTGGSGTAIIQIGETAVIKVEPKTTLEFTKIIESNKTYHGDFKKYYTPELYKIVNKVYHKDFELFNYPKLYK